MKRRMIYIWSEGALYIIGFKTAKTLPSTIERKRLFSNLRSFVHNSKSTCSRPGMLESESPDIKPIEERIEIIKREEFDLISNFTLPKTASLNNYYLPME